MSILEVKGVSIRYITGDLKEIGLKEYVTRKLTRNYHITEFWADRDITFTLERGEMLGIIGSNGAGKSTLLKAVSGIMEPTRGSIRREGSIAALLELGSGFDGDLTVRENTYLRGAMLGYTRQFMNESYDSIIDFAELRDFQDRPFKQLSSGMKSRLAFSIACLVRPDILILDEVLSVGDGAFKQKSEAKMKEIIRGGATTILVSHSIAQVRELCDKVLWLDRGRQIAFGDQVQELCDRYERFLARSDRSGRPEIEEGSLLNVYKDSVEEVSPVAKGYAGNFVNSSALRKSALFSRYDDEGNRTQFCAFYDADGYVTAARRKNKGAWSVERTDCTGQFTNAGKGISLAADGDGFVHLAWSGADGVLHHLVSDSPCGLEFSEAAILGRDEDSVTFPEFYLQPSGDLLLLYLYRRGGSMRAVLDRYLTKSREWIRVSDALIACGDNKTAYWQACTDTLGRLHISWCWRDTPDLRSNHDLCYLVSEDDSCSAFRRADGGRAELPVTQDTAIPIREIPEDSMLINQTSMTCNERNTPYIATYFRSGGAVQYHVLYPDDEGWNCVDTGIREGDVTVGGNGALHLPMARPQIAAAGDHVLLLIRDEERGSKASLVKLRLDGGRAEQVAAVDITKDPLGSWEPTYDPVLWSRENKLELFVQPEGIPDGDNGTKQEAWIHAVRVRIPE